ncbi:bifunctional adenosylcobinamide kinase/adenosylcobinamide-phosphate guanylyltransferase [Fusobacterium sp.]|uniref:bifunctional adenosylcobinamide kinase/adenosylcobinamide-phosphate guanylyltransferase n=1 Tax=Fusobacterium sp. TaxID=68766 RepID=UPI0028FEBF98|nr:bifunctional adenosylcobinamide kinase/adenosylcobinamide-phosphate guanylyltransferase [Fusobacterium sp.]MDU1911237.1 bifunctional adenosylcobinamide kinase/adenosylcobinamide-phosphate guanylyltransferase [Fusobacterium sp.]
MGRIIYFTGGSRSGKSRHAEQYIIDKEYKNRIYLATAIIFDDEMKARVAKHREQRGENWITIEGYKNTVELIKFHIKKEGVILLDCLTNMITNLMIMEKEYDWDHMLDEELTLIENDIKKEVEKLLEYIKSSDQDIVVVSNEIGMGIIPAYALGRHFRDICGRMNQMVAAKADEAYFVVSGIKMKLK